METTSIAATDTPAPPVTTTLVAALAGGVVITAGFLAGLGDTAFGLLIVGVALAVGVVVGARTGAGSIGRGVLWAIAAILVTGVTYLLMVLALSVVGVIG